MSEPLSIQLYNFRNLGDIDLALDIVANAGYRNVEGIGSHLDDAAVVAPKVAARGLKMTSCHVGLAALRERPQRVIDACKTFGFTDLYMPAVPPEQRAMDAAGWRAVGKELGEMADTFAKSGIALGYHNHHWEMQKKEGDKTALELLFEAAGSSPLAFEVDVAWLIRGEVDPQHWIAKYKSRVTGAHVKDIAPAGQNLDQDGWADVGHGTVDWKTLWQVCLDAGARHMVVEHDKPADPAATARRSIAYLRTITG